MEENQRSGQPSGVLVKKRSSSGCLILKKKGEFVSGASSSGFEKVYAAKKGKKRPRLIVSESDSSEEDLPLPPPRRAVGAETIRVCNGWNQEEARKRSRLDVFEFDEYDGFDEPPMGRRLFDDGRRFSRSPFEGNGSREKSVKPTDEAIRVQGRNGVLKVHMKNTGTSNKIDERKKVSRSVERVKSRSNLQKSFMPNKISKSSDEHSEDSDTLLKHSLKSRRTSRSEDISTRRNIIIPPSQEERKRYERPNSVQIKEKNKLNFEKSVSNKVNDSSDGDSEDSDSKNVRKRGSVSKVNEKTPKSKVPAPVKSIKRGCGTEKQKLRENIKTMLLEAGWTIDYRPRRNRDYLDAVYISPSGTAYWSIIKAYDAFQKQIQEDSDEEKAFKISDDILSQLTRKTQKKIQREMKNMQKDASGYENSRGSSSRKASRVKDEADSVDSDSQEDKLSSFMKSSKVKKTKDSLSTDLRKKSANSVKIRKQERCTLLVRRSDKGSNPENDGFVVYTGKRTILSWLIDSGVVELSQKVQYMNRRATRVLLEGWITKDGIHCGCCSKILTVSKFEIHAGSKLRQPFQNIYLESGVSLLQCQIDAWNKQEESDRSGFHSVDVDGDDPNDDTCGICGDGGDLICCDSCPSTFHQSCLSIEMLPMGDWHCPNCTCKFCGLAGVSDDTQDHGPISSDCLRCSLCERNFHKSCIKDMDSPSWDSTVARPFCSQQCTEFFDHLRNDLGVKHELEAGYSWSIIQRMDPNSDSSPLGHSQKVECNSKLAVALRIMDECFLPIVDRRSGINMIHNVLYNCGSNFNRVDYSGFYTVVLERGDEIISAASLRFHGTQLAEMPFIGTRHIYRRQGMCRRLFSAIESDLLRSLKVEQLIIPAIDELIQTWTSNFGFTSLEESLKRELSSLNILVFPGLDMLHKVLHKQETATSERTAATTDLGVESMEIQKEQKVEATSPGSDGPTSGIPIRNAEVDDADSDPIGRASSSGGGGTCPTRSSSLDNTADKVTESEVDQNRLAPTANCRVDGVSETSRPDKDLLDGTHEADDDDSPVAAEADEKTGHDSAVGVEMMSVDDEHDDTEDAKNSIDEEMNEKVKDASYSESIKKDNSAPNDSAVGNKLRVDDGDENAKNSIDEEMNEKVKDASYSETIKKDDSTPTDSAVGNELRVVDGDEDAKNSIDEEMNEKVKDASYSETIKKDDSTPTDSAVGNELRVDDECL